MQKKFLKKIYVKSEEFLMSGDEWGVRSKDWGVKFDVWGVRREKISSIIS